MDMDTDTDMRIVAEMVDTTATTLGAALHPEDVHRDVVVHRDAAVHRATPRFASASIDIDRKSARATTEIKSA